MNKIILIGRIANDLEQKTSKGKKNFTNFSLAVNEKIGNEMKSSFFSCYAFDKLSDLICKYLHKGSKIMIEGRVNINDYTDKNDVKRRFFDIFINNIEFLDSKSESNVKQADNELLPF